MISNSKLPGKINAFNYSLPKGRGCCCEEVWKKTADTGTGRKTAKTA
jgi:hypothetical protein